MSSHLIILGAGASLDFIDITQFDASIKRWRPPLSNEIFDTRRFYEILQKYPESSNLASYINSKLTQEGSWLESILTEIKTERAQKNEERFPQLASTLFYLAELFGVITKEHYRESNHHKALIETLSDNGIKPFIVNFNYDLLFEKSIGLEAKDINEYLTNSKYPILKIHGAYNWFHRSKVNSYEDNHNNSYGLTLMAARAIVEGEHKTEAIVIQNSTNPKNTSIQQIDFSTAYSYFPAIALPLNNKSHAISPQAHLDEFIKVLPSVERLLIVGWRAADPFLLELMKEHLNHSAKIGLISGDKAEETVLPNLSEYLSNEVEIVDSKYSTSLANGSLERFITS